MSFKIKDYERIEGKNTLQGAFTLVLGPIEIKSMMLHEKNGKRWIQFPSKSYIKDGETKYVPLLAIPDKRRYWDFVQWCLEELRDV